MIFDPFFIVHHLSQFLVLEPGDLINTGTPPGVGMGFEPPVWLQPGDVMELGDRGSGLAAAERARAAVSSDDASLRPDRPAGVRGGGGDRRRTAGPGEVVVDVERVGVCGTDVEFFTGEMAYLHDGHAAYPDAPRSRVVRARSRAVGEGVDPAWLGRRVMGDTMLGDGACRRCRRGHQHVCEHRRRDRHPRRPSGGAGRAARRAGLVPARPARRRRHRRSAHWSSPGGNACARRKAARPARATARWSSDRAPSDSSWRCSCGPGRRGAPDGPHRVSLAFARSLGFEHAWTEETLPDLAFDAVIDASNAAHLPALALDLVEPAGRVVYIGLAGQPQPSSTRARWPSRTSPRSASCRPPPVSTTPSRPTPHGAVDPRPLVAATVGLEEVAGRARRGAARDGGPRPQDPRRPATALNAAARHHTRVRAEPAASVATGPAG